MGLDSNHQCFSFFPNPQDVTDNDTINTPVNLLRISKDNLQQLTTSNLPTFQATKITNTLPHQTPDQRAPPQPMMKNITNPSSTLVTGNSVAPPATLPKTSTVPVKSTSAPAKHQYHRKKHQMTPCPLHNVQLPSKRRRLKSYPVNIPPFIPSISSHQSQAVVETRMHVPLPPARRA